jgi:hypothetical protein
VTEVLLMADVVVLTSLLLGPAATPRSRCPAAC